MDRLVVRGVEALMVATLAGMVLLAWLGPADFGVEALPIAAVLPVVAVVNAERALAGRSRWAWSWALLAALATLALALPAVAILSNFDPD